MGGEFRVGAGVVKKLKGSLSWGVWNSSALFRTGVCSKTLKSVGWPECRLRLLGLGVSQLADSKTDAPSRRFKGLNWVGTKRGVTGVVEARGCDRANSNLIGWSSMSKCALSSWSQRSALFLRVGMFSSPKMGRETKGDAFAQSTDSPKARRGLLGVVVLRLRGDDRSRSPRVRRTVSLFFLVVCGCCNPNGDSV